MKYHSDTLSLQRIMVLDYQIKDIIRNIREGDKFKIDNSS
jgi:hypothetical protein